MIPTGCGALDKLLDGGVAAEKVMLIYGEAETGKTCLAVQTAVNAARLGCKTIYIDSEGTFPSKRLSQIARHDLHEVSPMITVVKPATFKEQALIIDRLEEYLTPTVRLIIVDTATSLYRAEIGNKETTFELNRELGRQLASLAQLVRTKKLAVLITSQVHSTFTGGFVETEPVATRVLRFWADTVLNLKSTGKSHATKAVLEKHFARKTPIDCYVSMKEDGVCDYA